ncbi:hypothetical protein [Dyella acidiphila]|uniref:Uncharacterized protein n=1 Tax=Dyella acidiphila TaxID=2775866 RepID=A0ABR9GFH6_9GAMM|nr:hypothetical protein [Dyella acidiphila]MBE1162787.1 hypothetical protein [Dyella acidiphila]
MAENEVLDVGSRRNYKRWLAVVADSGVSASVAADRLAEDCLATLLRKLRAQPLYLVLKACGVDQIALQSAVATFKDASLARWVETAYRITQSTEPSVIARKVAELLIDGVQSQATRFTMRNDLSIDQNRRDELELATSTSLLAARDQIVEVLEHSLRNGIPQRKRSVSREQQRKEPLISRSLNPIANPQSKISNHVR